MGSMRWTTRKSGHESVRAAVGRSLTATKPTVDASAFTPPAGLLNQTFVASWTVSDSGGSGLSGVELWRTTDNNGVPLDSGWKKVNINSAAETARYRGPWAMRRVRLGSTGTESTR